MRRGLFITFEGGEGSGKTTQIKLLAERLRADGHDVVTTREPGGTPEAEKIRTLLVNRDGGAWNAMAEVLLFFAARVMHVDTLIKPALAAGKIVLCDRFTDSTRAYQSAGHGLPPETVEQVNTLALSDFAPDLTFMLDLPPTVGLRRAQSRRGNEDRFEQLDLTFHEKLRDGYRTIAAREPQRCRLINAEQSIDSLSAEILSLTQEKLAAHG